MDVRASDYNVRRRNVSVPDVPAQEVSALVAAGRLMQAAGDEADCIAYLMGNHTIAERMFRDDPRVMLYAPLHTVIWEDSTGRAWFTVDQPSTQFSSFERPEIAAVGRDLDRKLATLLDAPRP